MKRAELIKSLQWLETKGRLDEILCLGCGHEHNCSIHGCAVIRQAVEALRRQTGEWIRCTDALPDDPCELVLVIANGWTNGYTPLVNSQQLAVYSPGDGWMLEEYPEAEEITVRCWAHIPQPPEWV